MKYETQLLYIYFFFILFPLLLVILTEARADAKHSIDLLISQSAAAFLH